MLTATRLPSSTSVDAPAREAGRLVLAAPALLLLLSGAASLVYQLLWIKQLSLVVGVEVYAVTTAVSAFFAGLAFGGYAFGGIADRSARPLQLYALLEAGIALLAFAATLLLARAAPWFAHGEDRVGVFAWLLPFMLVGIPALLMGGTLPVLMRVLAPQTGNIGRSGGRLYAANTAGAIVGTLLAPFVLIPAFGVTGSAAFAALLNLLAAAAALLLAARLHVPAAPASAATTTPAHSGDARIAVALYAIAGGIALGYEVVWSQTLVQFMSTRAFAFAVVLATYLAGLVIGSALAARHADRIRDPWAVFGLLIAAAGLVALLEVSLLGGWLLHAQSAVAAALRGVTDNMLAVMCARFAVAALSIVFVPTVLLGAAFPFVLRLAVDPQRIGRGVGRVVALNTLGGIVGSLLVGFALVPALGIVRALALLALAAAALGVFAALRGRGQNRVALIATFATGLLAVVVAVLTPPQRLATLLSEARGGTLIAYEESRGGTVAVVEQQAGRNHFRRLYIQGVSNSGDTMTSLRYMRLQALLPLLITPQEPKSALVIGLGTGITAGALTRYPLDTRVVAELLPAVQRATPNFTGNYDVAHDPRVDIRLRDGRRELLRSDARYDLITLEPPPPSASGVVNLYSQDFYRLAAERLQDGGLVAQWLPLPTQNDEDTRALVRAFINVFPHATLWTTELHEMLLVGGMQRFELDVPRISARYAQPDVARALHEVGVSSPAALLATYVTDRAGLERYAGATPPVTDDRPRIEYATWTRPGEFVVALNGLLAQRSAPPLQNSTPEFDATLATEQATLQRFYSAGIAAYQGDRTQWAQAMNDVMDADPTNPYYRWFGGGSE